ncbi:MAG: ribonuclease [Betaproteobacteria bacterium]|nr:ribonuclease [Betaproteobacteria bacterium]
MKRLALLFSSLALLALPVLAFDPGTVKALPSISASELPKEGRDTLALIKKGGPFPYAAKDGSTFSNRERTLPKQPRGYYREYTVKTPGSRDRGARRIVCGGKEQRECYYTADHYKTFKRIQE